MNELKSRQTLDREKSFSREGLLRSVRTNNVVLTAAEATFAGETDPPSQPTHHDHHHHDHHDHHHHDHHEPKPTA